MKHLITIIQFLWFILMDLLLFLWHFKWNMYLYNPSHCFLKDGLFVRVANNYDKRCQKKTSLIKYIALFF
jgi:hypothetical protein